MFQFRNNRLYPDLSPQILSLEIPDGLWLDTEPCQTGRNLIIFRTPDKSAELTLRFGTMRGRSVREGIGNFLRAIGEDTEIRDVSYAGFHGCAADYHSGTEGLVCLDISALHLHDTGTGGEQGKQREQGEPADMLELSVSARDAQGFAGVAGYAEVLLGSLMVHYPCS